MIKKTNILAVSVIAIMAVGAARADIASTEYVTNRTGDTSTITVSGATDLTGAVNALNTQLGTISTTAGNAATKTELTDGLAAKEDTANKVTVTEGLNAAGVGDSTTKFPSMATTNQMIDNKMAAITASVTKEEEAREDADTNLQTQITANKDALDTLNGTGTGSISQQITNVKNEITEQLTGTDGILDQAKAYADTKASDAETAAAADATTKADAAKAAAIADAATKYQTLANISKAATAVADSTGVNADTKYPSAAGAKAIAESVVSDANTNIASLQTRMTTAEGQITTLETDNAANKTAITANATAAANAQTAADNAQKAADAKVATAQGTANAGKGLVVNSTGNLELQDIATQTELDAVNTTATNAASAAAAAQTAADAKVAQTTYNTEIGTVSAANMGTTATSVVAAIKEVATEAAAAQTQADKGVADAATAQAAANAAANTANAAIPKPSGTCVDCVLHYNGTAFSWEEIGR